jgi:Na+/H+ antiporter NhaC
MSQKTLSLILFVNFLLGVLVFSVFPMNIYIIIAYLVICLTVLYLRYFKYPLESEKKDTPTRKKSTLLFIGYYTLTAVLFSVFHEKFSNPYILIPYFVVSLGIVFFADYKLRQKA